jgi:hypothetical protein
VRCKNLQNGVWEEWGVAVLFRRHTRARLGERRREAKLSCQRILEEMDCERWQLKERCVANASPKAEEVTLHRVHSGYARLA